MVDRNTGILLDHKDFLKSHPHSGSIVGTIDIDKYRSQSIVSFYANKVLATIGKFSYKNMNITL